MAFTNTQGSFFLPFQDPQGAVTPSRIEILQTSGNGLATSGMIGIFESGTASDNFRLYSLNVSVVDATAASIVELIVGENTVAALSAGSAGQFSHEFGTWGLMGGTTTTHTCYLNVRTATSTVGFVAIGGRLV